MLIKNKICIFGIVLSVLMFLLGCDKTWDDHYKTQDKTTEKDKIIAELEKIPEISKFTEAVKNNDTLVDLLNQNRLYTVFAPVNETFETIDPEILNNETLLNRLVLYHFVNGKFKYKDFSYGQITTFNDKSLSISIDNSNKVLLDNNSTIVHKDFLSQNGMIQLIDQPLIPLHNLYEYFTYNTYSSQFAKAISNYTTKEFNQVASTPIGTNNNNELIYDSVFIITNPFLYTGSDGITTNFYGRDISYMNIADEDMVLGFVFPTNYESAFNSVKNSPFLNNSISDHHWAGPILVDLIFDDLISKEEIIADIEDYHALPSADTSKVMLYFADLLKNKYNGYSLLSNGVVHLVDEFEYDLGWLITDQGNVKANELETDYRDNLMTKITYSDSVNDVRINLNNIRTTFYNDTNVDGYNLRYGEWVNFELVGYFYPVDYKILVRGKNFASGTFTVEADGKEIREYDFSSAPSGDLDTQFDEIGTVSFTETKSVTNLKFTFINTHPDSTNTGEQYLWIREIKFSPIIK